MFKDTLKELKVQINDYVKSGGDIYNGIRNTPYLNLLTKTQYHYKKEHNADLPVEKIYKLCGVEYNKEYQSYKVLLTNLKKCSDKNNYVNFDSKKPFDTAVNSMLKYFAKKTNLTPSEYLILMTDFRTKKVFTNGNYLRHIQIELDSAFPDNIVTKISQYPHLYTMIRNFQRYYHMKINYNEALKFFGKVNGNEFGTPIKEDYVPKISEEEVLKELNETYKDKKVTKLATDNIRLYTRILQQVRYDGYSVKQWLKSKGFEYDGKDMKKFAKFQVDEKNHTKRLTNLKQSLQKIYLEEDFCNKKPTEIEMFELNTKIATTVGSIVHKDADFKKDFDLKNYIEKAKNDEIDFDF